MIVSADTELAWLYKFIELSSSFHQLIGVPVFQDGGNCGLYGGSFPVLEKDQMAFVGVLDENVQTNENIFCPKI